jgi:hypothetical protein
MFEIRREHQVIYDRLQDEESRQLFLCRYAYYLDGNVEHLYHESKISNEFKRVFTYR